ncbi:unnamed protein product [Periconia digitata]|uniref:carbonic anhydrase n=1 Tax=Periconia digitata TaxID=1303443 RepID=A0A9W4UHX0_9PLEO|nr:unnamed protein product [Periconia digitata]
MLAKTLLFASTASATCLHGVFKRAEGGIEPPAFGYDAMNGPHVWAGLKEENKACSSGQVQSPINIDSSVQQAAAKPEINFPQAPVKFENLGTTIEVIMNGTTKVGDAEFTLKQYHIHTPSEHRINREYSPLEVHMVHTSTADPTQVAVIALMFELSTEESAPIIAGITPSLSQITAVGTETDIEAGIDTTSLAAHIASSNVLQYTGSLTTPPCSEGVTFMIVEDPLPISVADFNAIKKVVKFNSRFTQNTLDQQNLIGVAAEVAAGNTTMVEAVRAAHAATLTESGAGEVSNGTTPVEAAAPSASAPAAAAKPMVSVININMGMAVGGSVAAEIAANAPKPGETVAITEMSGAPMPTPIAGIVQRRRAARNSL